MRGLPRKDEFFLMSTRTVCSWRQILLDDSPNLRSAREEKYLLLTSLSQQMAPIPREQDMKDFGLQRLRPDRKWVER